MTRTDVSALALAAMLSAGGAAGALAQTATEEPAADGAVVVEPSGGGTAAEGAPDAAGEADVIVVQEGDEPEGGAATEEAPAAGALVPQGEVAQDDAVVTDQDDAIVADEVEPVEVETAEPVEGQIFEQSPDQVLGSTLLDATVVSPDGETIGDVADMVVSADGQVTGVVIGVGGFLGIGEREVAIEYGRIEVRQTEGTDDLTFVLDATREQIEAAPEFRTRADLETGMPAEGAGTTGEPVVVETDPDAVVADPNPVVDGTAEPGETVIKPAD